MTSDRLIDHLVLLVGVFVFVGPVALLLVLAASPGGVTGDVAPSVASFTNNLDALERRIGADRSVAAMLWMSMQMAFGVALVTSVCGFLAAFALTHFAGVWTRAVFWLTLLTLYFPVEARMLPTFEVAHALGLVDTLASLILPIVPLAVATFYLRQHLLRLPRELSEAARLDGAGPLKFLVDIAVPLSWTPIATVFLIAFILGWNQYLWPLMISVNETHYPIMRGFALVGAGTGASLVLAVVAMGPPLLLMWLILVQHRRTV